MCGTKDAISGFLFSSANSTKDSVDRSHYSEGEGKRGDIIIHKININTKHFFYSILSNGFFVRHKASPDINPFAKHGAIMRKSDLCPGTMGTMRTRRIAHSERIESIENTVTIIAQLKALKRGMSISEIDCISPHRKIFHNPVRVAAIASAKFNSICPVINKESAGNKSIGIFHTNA